MATNTARHNSFYRSYRGLADPEEESLIARDQPRGAKRQRTYRSADADLERQDRTHLNVTRSFLEYEVPDVNQPLSYQDRPTASARPRTIIPTRQAEPEDSQNLSLTFRFAYFCTSQFVTFSALIALQYMTDVDMMTPPKEGLGLFEK